MEVDPFALVVHQSRGLPEHDRGSDRASGMSATRSPSQDSPVLPFSCFSSGYPPRRQSARRSKGSAAIGALLALVALAGSAVAARQIPGEHVRIVLVGDSTVAEGGGWGPG